MTGGRLAAFAAGVAEALDAIHAAGVVHRDLKPGNLLLPGGGSPEVKVIDFGIAWAADATMTRSGPRFGTPSWMAPEQLRDQPAGPPADVFAWGLLVAFDQDEEREERRDCEEQEERTGCAEQEEERETPTLATTPTAPPTPPSPTTPTAPATPTPPTGPPPGEVLGS